MFKNATRWVKTLQKIAVLTGSTSLIIACGGDTEGGAPVADLSLSSNTSGSAPLIVQFDASASTDDDGIVNYAWDLGEGSFGFGPRLKHTYNTAGTYKASVRVYDTDGQLDQQQILITVTEGNNTPTSGNNGLAVSIDATPKTGPAPLIVEFTSSMGAGQAETYRWDFGTGNETGSSANPKVKYDNAGTYDVSLTVTDKDGKSTSAATQIIVTEPQNVGNNAAPIARLTASVTQGPAPLSVRFDASQSSDDKGIVEYVWLFDKNERIVGQNQVDYIFNNPGTYDVMLAVKDLEGQSSVQRVKISVDPNGGNVNIRPQARFSTDKSEGPAPLAISFDASEASDDKAIVDYQWTFGDGSTASGEKVSHSYSNAGNYIAKLQVTDAEGLSDYASQQIVVNNGSGNNQAPQPVISATPETGDAPLTVQLSASGTTDDGGALQYAWKLGNGRTSNQEQLSTTYSEAGTYTVELSVTDNQGLSARKTMSIVVNDPADSDENTAPVAIAKASVTEGDAPLSVSFNAGDSTDDGQITAYNWDFKNGVTANATNVTTSFQNPGDYRVTLTVEDDGGLSSTQEIVIRVNDPASNNSAPVAQISESTTEGQAPLTVDFDSNGSSDDAGIVSTNWEFGDGNTSNAPAPSHTFTAPGTYMTRLTVADEAGLTNSTVTVIRVLEAEVNAAPEANITVNTNSGDAPLEVIFNGSASSDDNGITAYSWNFGDGESGEGDRVSHVFDTAGSYQAVLTVTDAEGETDTASVTITVNEVVTPEPNQAPVAALDADKTEGTAPLSVSFDASSSSDDDGIASFSWSMGNGETRQGEAFTYTFDEAGSYTVALTVTDTDGVSRTRMQVIVVEKANEAPVAKASANVVEGDAPLAVNFDGSTSTDDKGIASYSWNFGDGDNSSNDSPSHTFDTPGTYSVRLTVTDAEGLTSNANVTITVNEAVDLAAEAEKLYNAQCTTCHKEDGTPAFSTIPSLVGRTLNQALITGTQAMLDQYGDCTALGDKCAEAVAQYIVDTFIEEASTFDAAAAQAEYEPKCGGCHGKDGSGGPLYPAPISGRALNDELIGHVDRMYDKYGLSCGLPDGCGEPIARYLSETLK